MGEMRTKSDAQLLRDYAERREEAAFSELVARHMDLIYSAAWRQVGAPDLAADIAQSVFIDLARKAPTLAGKLPGEASLVGWLYRSTRFAALNHLRDDRRRLAHERQAMEQLLANSETAPDWNCIRPVLDEAMESLDEADRDAVLLRYFKNHDFRAVGLALGISDDAAQKRVSRAVERLREFFSKRGVAVGAGGLVVAISANAVQAAPAGLAPAISSAAALVGATLYPATTAATLKTFTMTTLFKSFVTATIVVVVAGGIYQTYHATQLAGRARDVLGQSNPLVEPLRRLQQERDDATNRLAVMSGELARLKSQDNAGELLRLRGEVGVLRQQLALLEGKTALPARDLASMLGDPAMREYIHQNMLMMIRLDYAPLFKELKLTPDQTEKVVQLIGDTTLKNSDKMYSLPRGSVRPDDVARTAEIGRVELENQLRPLLGDSGLARLWEFHEEMPAHATVDLLNAQLGANPLSPELTDRVFRIVKAEPYDLTRGMSGDWDKAFWGSQQDIDDHLLKVAESNQRVLQQAENFLNTNQLAALGAVLSNGITARITQAEALIQKP
jgi:RNA polymerase sigma factor (sigma-70 family)